MFTVNDIISTIYEVKKSKFHSFLMPYSNFKEEFEKIKADHPKARHIVYAYRFINEFDQIVENQTDDGEPKGSAGKPSLDVLRGSELVNTALITVRYFGGIKLGIGGMVRAYGGAVNEVITQSNLVKYEKLFTIEKDINFNAIASFEHFIKDLEPKTVTKNFHNEGAVFKIEAPDEVIQRVDQFDKS